MLGIVIDDDGCGFDRKLLRDPAAGHYGMVGMRERIEYLDGKLEVESSPGHGTRITITAPVKRILPKANPTEKVHGDA
jgi:two-component system sensor histidine kinase DegS